MSHLQLNQVRRIDPFSGQDDHVTVYVDGLKIVGIDTAPADFSTQQTLTTTTHLLMPAMTDLAVHLSQNPVDDVRAAQANGIGQFCVPPDMAMIDKPQTVERLCALAPNNLQPIGALTVALAGAELANMAALKAAGCVALSNGNRPFVNTRVQRRALEYAADLGLPVFLQPLDHALAGSGCAHEGAVASRLGLPVIPAEAETIGLARDLELVKQTGVQAHFCRLSTARSVELIADAQARGLLVTADVAAHQLHLTEADLENFDANYHVLPPLRSATDRDALRQGVRDGVIDAICSDHQPHSPNAKRAPFPATAPGISALDTLLPLTLQLVAEKVLDLPCAIQRLTAGPANCLQQGKTTAWCLVDTAAAIDLNASTMASPAHNTPFLGHTLSGRVVAAALFDASFLRQAQDSASRI